MARYAAKPVIFKDGDSYQKLCLLFDRDYHRFKDGPGGNKLMIPMAVIHWEDDDNLIRKIKDWFQANGYAPNHWNLAQPKMIPKEQGLFYIGLSL